MGKHWVRITTISVVSLIALVGADALQAEETAISACAAALAQRLSEASRVPMESYVFEERARFAKPSRSLRRTAFRLRAVHPKTGQILARADCRVDRDGHLKRMERVYVRRNMRIAPELVVTMRMD